MDGTHRNPPGGRASVSAEVERDLGALVPPIAVHAPAPATMTATWTMLRAVVVEPGLVDRTTKEAVATAVAHSNGCWCCEELHLTVLESLNRRRVDCELSTLADHRVRRITEWARSAGLAGARRPFADAHVPELVGTVVVSHYLDRMVTVRSDRVVALSAEQLKRVAARASRAPGEGAVWLPAGELPAGLDWARGSAAVADAFGRAAAVLDRGVPESVRAVVSARLAGWRGEVPEDDEWLGAALAGVAGGEVAMARLAVLTAIAPRRVDRLLVDVVRERSGERGLVELTSWAAFAGACRIGAWLGADADADRPHGATVLPFRRATADRRAIPGGEQRQAEI